MRILYVCLDRGIPLGGTKGASIHVAELLSAFDAEGHDTAAVARSVLPEAAERRPVLRAPSREGMGWVPGRFLRRDLRELALGPSFRKVVRRAIRTFQPDLVYERYSLFRTEALSEARRAGVPMALEVNAPLVEEERRFRGLALRAWAARAERRLWRGTDLVVVPSGPLGRRVQAVGQPNVLVVPNAVDPEVFKPSADGPAVRVRLGLTGRFVTAFAGSLKGWHDLPTLFRAVAALEPALRASLLVVGDGPERARLEEEARALGVDARFTGAIPHEDVPSHLAAADACVAGLPDDATLDYFSPLKALEYLACGIPTVVATVGDMALLAAEGTALGYRPGDADHLASRLRALATDPELRDRLADAGPTVAAERTWRAAARSIVQAVDRLPRTASMA